MVEDREEWMKLFHEETKYGPTPLQEEFGALLGILVFGVIIFIVLYICLGCIGGVC